MQRQNLSSAYLFILDDCLAKVKSEYVNEGVDEYVRRFSMYALRPCYFKAAACTRAILHTIRKRTEERLRQRGVITDDDKTEEGGPSPSKAAAASAATAAQPAKQEGDDDNAADPEAPSSSRKRPYDGTGPDSKAEAVKDPQGPQPVIPQQDGAADEAGQLLQQAAAALGLDAASLAAAATITVPGLGLLREVPSGTLQALQQAAQPAPAAAPSTAAPPNASSRRWRQQQIPQCDGPGDNGAGGYNEEDDGYDEQPAADDDEGSDLGDPEVDVSDGEEDADQPTNLGFAMYEKVHRAKNRWRANLRYGVINIEGKEYMFNKALAEMTF